MERVKRQLGCSEKIQKGIKTERVTVAALDTGISPHPDFAGRIVGFFDFVNGREGLYDDSGHGTHVAGCIGGSGQLSGGRFGGIAPACRLFVGKVLDAKGEGSMEGMHRALLWVLENRLRFHIRVLNISVGLGESGQEERMKELVSLLERLSEEGVTVVCAAGNKGPEEGSLSPLGVSSRVITVGCHEGGFFGARKDLCEHYSGRGAESLPYRKPDIVAPGTDIISCNSAAYRDRRGNYRNAYVKKSGTSMATPIVSGAAALFCQTYPDCESDSLKRRMIYSARDLGEAGSKQGWGILDIGRLMEMGM